MDRNVCRCGTYPRIVHAVRLAAQRMQDDLVADRRQCQWNPNATSCRRRAATRSSSSGATSCACSAAACVVMVAAADLLAQESGRARPQGGADAPELAAWLHIDENGRVTVYTGKVEIGQNIRTSLAQTVADELRVPLASITMVMADTDLTPFDQGTFGSQTTPRMAPQLARAAATAREMLIDLAARALAGRSRDADGARRTDRRRTDGRALTYGELTKGQKLSGTIPPAPAGRRRATSGSCAAPRRRR